MDIEIFGYTFRVEILVLIAFVYWLIWAHVLCSCSKVGLQEGMEIVKGEIQERFTGSK